MDGGYVFLHRRVLDSALWSLRSHQIIIAEICLLKAVWKDTTVRGIPVRRGQWLTHYSTIKDLCPKGITLRQVRRGVKILTSEKVAFLVSQVVTRLGRRWLLLTVCNYDTYNPRNSEGGTGVGTGVGTRRADGGHDNKRRSKEVKKKDKDVAALISDLAVDKSTDVQESVAQCLTLTGEYDRRGYWAGMVKRMYDAYPNAKPMIDHMIGCVAGTMRERPDDTNPGALLTSLMTKRLREPKEAENG